MARSDDDDIPEADRVADAPHPRAAARVFGQRAAEAEFLAAWGAGRLHHAWLLTGPRGVGKATLAYRIARARLATEDGGALFGGGAPASLDIEPENPVARRIAAGAEPRLFALTRAYDEKAKRLRTVIRVDDVRRLKSFFQLSAADGGWRVAVVDAADEMNAEAANALLKLLEEPPAKSMILLVAHAPARLLPTLRSRCRALALAPLDAADLGAALAQAGLPQPAEIGALAALAGGSAGEAARLIEGDGPALYARLVDLALGAPMDRGGMIALAEACAGRGAAPVYDLTLRLVGLLLARLARAAAMGPPAALAAPGEAALFERLAAGPGAARLWADLAAEIEGKGAAARAVNLDPAHVMLDILFALDAAARKARARAA